MENKSASSLVVSLGKALNWTPPPLCGKQVAQTYRKRQLPSECGRFVQNIAIHFAFLRMENKYRKKKSLPDTDFKIQNFWVAEKPKKFCKNIKLWLSIRLQFQRSLKKFGCHHVFWLFVCFLQIFFIEYYVVTLLKRVFVLSSSNKMAHLEPTFLTGAVQTYRHRPRSHLVRNK